MQSTRPLRRLWLPLLMAASTLVSACGATPGMTSGVGSTLQARNAAAPTLVAPRFTENQASLVYDAATFRAMLDLCASAKRSIDLDYYIMGGPMAERIAEILVWKHREGVRVRVILDPHLGTLPALRKESQRFLDPVKAAGIPVVHPTRPLPQGRSRIDHNKYFVVDGERALIGSMNVAEKFQHYHDVMLRIDGPAAADLANQFEVDWYWHQRPEQSPPLYKPFDPGQRPAVKGQTSSQIRIVGTGTSRRTLKPALMQALKEARRSILVQMHELGDDEALDALIAAHRRGLDVRVLLDPGDLGPFVPVIHRGPMGVLNVNARRRLLEARVPLHTYLVNPTMTTAHMKLTVIDGEVLILGSANWTESGFATVDETDAQVVGGRAIQQAVEQFEVDWQSSRPAEWPTAVQSALYALYQARSNTMPSDAAPPNDPAWDGVR